MMTKKDIIETNERKTVVKNGIGGEKLDGGFLIEKVDNQ